MRNQGSASAEERQQQAKAKRPADEHRRVQMEQAPGKADERIQAEPHQAAQPPVLGDVVGDRRRPGVIEFDKALAEAVRQEDAITELAQQLYLRLELGTEGRGGDEAAAPAAATAAAAGVGQHPVEAVGNDAGAFIVGMEAVGGERGPVGSKALYESTTVTPMLAPRSKIALL